MTAFDDIAETKCEEEWREWKAKLNNQLDAVAKFVAEKRGGGRCYNRTGYFAGSFNVCIQFGFEDDGPDAIIRFPKKGLVMFRDEKVLAEVSTIRFIQEHTTIPTPRIISWGLTAESPGGLGPFIIMDFVEGVLVTSLTRKPDQAKFILNPDIEKKTLEVIYDQIADFMVQLDAFDFKMIGTLRSIDQSPDYLVEGRPWTYNMNELATSCNLPADLFHAEPMKSSDDYMNMLARLHLDHLVTQRNLAEDSYDASRRYIARHLFAKLCAKPHRLDSNRFKLFCDDLRPGNMLIDKETLRITAVLDFEFTNALPIGFAESPPWWLLIVGPDMFLERGFSMSRFVELYEPQLEIFLEAMIRQEQKTSSAQEPLSSRMRKSWESGDFWYFFAARKSLDIDAIFYEQLDRLFFGGEAGAHLLDSDQQSEMDQFVKMKMQQKSEYDKEYATIRGSDIASEEGDDSESQQDVNNFRLYR